MKIAAFLFFTTISLAMIRVDTVAESAGVTWTSQSPISLFQELGEDPASVAVGDVDGDGTSDLVIANNRSNDITVLLGNASGFTVAGGRPPTGGSGAESIALVDIDSDGALDVVTANSSSDDVSVLLGDASGGFSPAAGSPFPAGDGPQSVAVIDVDGDGFLDIVVANGFSDNATVLLGDGGGGFAGAVGSPFSVGDDPRSLALADLDSDGTVDLVTANRLSGNVSVLHGDGSGGFTAAVGSPIAVGNNPESVALGDVDGNGSPDIVTANRFQSHNVSVLLADGSGTFVAAAGSPIPVGLFPESVALGDVDGDGSLDILSASSQRLTVLIGNGGGAFTEATASPFAFEGIAESMALADIDGDAILDVVTANARSDSVSFILGDGSGGFTEADSSPLAFGGDPVAVAVGDLDGDDIADAMVALQSRNVVVALRGHGNGRFSEFGPRLPIESSPDSVVLDDVNGDSTLDLITVANKITVLLGNGTGGFQAAAGSPFSAGFNPLSVALGDINGDGANDIVTANAGSSDVSVLLGDGGGGFVESPGSPFSTGGDAGSVALGDLDGDADLDVVVADRILGNVSVLLGDGAGGFAAAAGSPFAVGGNFPSSIALGDFNGDGALDAVTANSNSRDVSVLLGDGSGGFSAAIDSPFTVGSGPDSVAVSDVDGDGALDLVTANRGSNDVTLLLGDGAGGFTVAAGSPIRIRRGPQAIALQDIDGDGRPDAVVTSDGSFIPGDDEFLNVLTSDVLFLDSVESPSVE